MAATTVLAPPAITTQRPPSPLSPTVYDDNQRQSFVSTSGTSFFTAKASPVTPSTPNPLSESSRESSVDTLNALPSCQGEGNNSSVVKQVVHTEDVVRAVNETLVFETGSVSPPAFQASGKTVTHVAENDCTNNNATEGSVNPVGPPPPSPPASVEQDDLPDMPTLLRHKSESAPRATLAEDIISPRGRMRQSSVDSRDAQHLVAHPSPPSLPKSSGEPHELPQRSSTDTMKLSTFSSRSGTLTMSPRIARVSGQSDGSVLFVDTPVTEVSTSPSVKYASQSGDGLLHPPPSQSQSMSGRPTRRNTAPVSLGRTVRSLPQQGTYENGDIEEDIQMQAEQIRRERKRKAEVEAEMTRTTSMRPGTSSAKEDDNKPLVGNLIGEGHVNYVLMYNMLTGIRIAVSRCQAKIKRPLTDEDFTARHKYSFDIVGNELTPSAKYDFKFKDYAPWVFRELREDYFQLDPADYLLSLTAKYILSELGSPGKSGSFFYFSRDYRFIIKTIRHSEHKFLLSMLKEYYAHVKDNPHTLLSRFYGLHRVKLPRGRKIHFVIMNNLFPPHKDIHETYDLKGSTVGRVYPEEKAQKNPRAVLKDLNWINRGKMLELGPEKRALLTEQLRRDSELLKKIHVMDYSLLVGIHHMRRGNRENVRSNTLKVFSPSVPIIRRKSTHVKGARSPQAIAMRRAMRASDLKRIGSEALDLPEEDTGDRQYFIFYQDEGGLQATDEANQPMDTLYYLGVIDILTPYTSLKKVEHFWKGLSADRHKISPVPPTEYAERFFNFMKAIMRGGEGGARFKAE
ncbi:hypothetical protein ID866_8472 [Astraeus odoratus]|nr:hypothetical protein ID866_8472 [Astraeus odoratus]